jgi:glycosyltransferase involved in cell wall biosynthesis
MHNGSPLVTVVIPTRNRPELIGRAVRSALQQTLTDLEVIVVVDGPDPATVLALEPVQRVDARLRVLPLPENVGGSDARNAGIQVAKGEWIALLDDDDEWMPQKLTKQLAMGECSSHPLPVLSCMTRVRTPKAEYTWPRTEPFLPIGDYLVRRNGLFQGEGVLLTSTLVARRELFHDCWFRSGLRRHQDLDWMIRAFDRPGVGLEFVREPLIIFSFEENRPSTSSTDDWRHSLDWVNGMRLSLAPATYAAFVLTCIGASASNQGDWSAFIPLLASAVRKGRPRAIHFALYIGMWLLPRNFRQFIRGVLSGSSQKAVESK